MDQFCLVMIKKIVIGRCGQDLLEVPMLLLDLLEIARIVLRSGGISGKFLACDKQERQRGTQLLASFCIYVLTKNFLYFSTFKKLDQTCKASFWIIHRQKCLFSCAEGESHF